MDNLTIIRQVIAAHRAIRGHIKLVGEAITDREALFDISRESPRWLPGRLEMAAQRRTELQQKLSALDQGLQNHFAYEEKFLPPLLGDLFMQALLFDHRQIRKELDSVKSMVADTGLEGLSPEQVVFRQSQVHRVINDMREKVEEHAQREENMLTWLERALSDKETRS